LVIAAVRWLRDRDSMDLAMIGAGICLIVTIAAYSAYLASGLTASLWAGGDGFYFSENDVLHIGMILFIAYLVAVVAKRLRDKAPSTASGGRGRPRLHSEASIGPADES
jgi:hypothetical protein